jgi:EAL domain-containing protein (putative c-di-GMP-specific phosphodiesterase class I)
VLLDGAGLSEARPIAERLRETIQAYRFTLNDRRFMLGLSIGAVRIDGQHNTQTLMAQADMALHTAKDQGRNRVVLYNPAETNLAQLSKAHLWVTRIKEALWEDRFVLHFQPIVRLSDGAIAHYEVLLRMQHEDEGTELILPGTFIPAAERFGLMPAIDVWLVRHAIQTLHDHPDIHLFINLSGRSRGDEGLLELIEELLREYEVNPARLGFELTETVAVQDLAQAKEWIGRLKALGCRFALDDFGVGYTSFAYLRSLPVDQIKIDGSFIRSLEQEASSREIVQTMHTLAQSLGKETVAEFVENETIYRLVRAMGLTYAQGFYLGQPGPELPRTLPPAVYDTGYVHFNRGPQPTNLV